MNGDIQIQLPIISFHNSVIINQLSYLYDLTKYSKYHDNSNQFVFRFDHSKSNYIISFSSHLNKNMYPSINIDCSFIEKYNEHTLLISILINALNVCLQIDTTEQQYYTHICITILIHLIQFHPKEIISQYNKQDIELLQQLYNNYNLESTQIRYLIKNMINDCLSLIKKYTTLHY